MTQERASIFETEPGADFDVSGFAPKKPETKQTSAPAEAIRAVAETAKFPSREPAAAVRPVAAPIVPVTREIRRHRTGRNIQLNIKTKPETLDAFYKLADSQGWVLGETFEEAIIALKEKLEKTK